MAPIPVARRERRIVGTSLKMYFSHARTQSYIDSLLPLSKLAEQNNVDLFVIPDFLSLTSASHKLSASSILLGAQDCFWEDEGAYTGEISPKMLKEIGVRIVELGHAERRTHLGETDEQVGKKVAAACRNGLIPLVCIGEKTKPGAVASQAVGQAVEECRVQLDAVLQNAPDHAEIVLAYEPVWAIGAQYPAGADHVVAVAGRIRELVKARKGRTRILYGGSAGPGTFKNLSQAVDGLFLGRYAHDVKQLEAVIGEMGET